MARTKQAGKASNKTPTSAKKRTAPGAVRRKILGGIRKPHKYGTSKEEKQAFRAFLKRLEERDIKLEKSGEAIGPDESNDSRMFEVEEILDSSTIRGELHFYVLWKGHLLESCTWESEKGLGCAMDLIDEFYEFFPKKVGGPDAKPKGRKRSDDDIA